MWNFFLSFVPKWEGRIGALRAAQASREGAARLMRETRAAIRNVLLFISTSYWAEMQVAIAVAEPAGCFVCADDAGLVGWTPELHLLGTTGWGPLCTGLG